MRRIAALRIIDFVIDSVSDMLRVRQREFGGESELLGCDFADSFCSWAKSDDLLR